MCCSRFLCSKGGPWEAGGGGCEGSRAPLLVRRDVLPLRGVGYRRGRDQKLNQPVLCSNRQENGALFFSIRKGRLDVAPGGEGPGEGRGS